MGSSIDAGSVKGKGKVDEDLKAPEEGVNIVEDARQDNIDAMDQAIAAQAKEPPPAEAFDFSDVEAAVLDEPQTEDVVKAKEAGESTESPASEAVPEAKPEGDGAAAASSSAADSQGLRDDQILRATQLGVPFAQIATLDANAAEAVLSNAQKYVAAYQAQQQYLAQQQAAQQAPKPFDVAAETKKLVDQGWDETIAKTTAEQSAKVYELEQKLHAQANVIQHQTWLAQQEAQQRALTMFNQEVASTLSTSLGDVVKNLVANDAAKVAAVQDQTIRLWNSYTQAGLTPPAKDALISQAAYALFGREIAEHASGKRAEAVQKFKSGATDRVTSQKTAADNSREAVKARFVKQISRIV